MKLTEIIKVVAQELGTSDLKEINKILKTEPAVKFRVAGKALGHFGFTGQIKSISEEGIKVFMANKVSLIRLSDIETFEKAKPRSERPVRTAKPQEVVKVRKGTSQEEEEDSDFADISDEEFVPKKIKKGQAKVTGKSGSKFIPSFKK